MIATDYFLRTLMSSIRSFSVVLNEYGRRCFTKRGLQNANNAARAQKPYYAFLARGRQQVISNANTKAILSHEWNTTWGGPRDAINFAAKNLTKVPGIDILSFERNGDKVHFYGPFEPGVCVWNGTSCGPTTKPTTKCWSTCLSKKTVYYIRLQSTTQVQNADKLLSQGKPAVQSSNISNVRVTAAKAVDGNTDGVYSRGSCTHTSNTQTTHWWRVDLQQERTIKYVKIWNRVDCCGSRLKGAQIKVDSMVDAATGAPSTNATVCAKVTRVNTVQVIDCQNPLRGRYLFVMSSGKGKAALTLCEVAVYGQ